MSSSLQITNRLGMVLNVAIEGDADPLDVARGLTQRGFARRGWRWVNVPHRGIKMPLCMANTFDWDLIGAQPGSIKDDKQNDCPGVWFDGSFYKRRDLAANPKKDMEECVKYSRGFRKSTDEPSMAEGDDDGVQYVTLIIFRGSGASVREFERKGKQSAQESKPVDLDTEIKRIVEQKKITDRQLHTLVLGVTGKRVREYSAASEQEKRRIVAALNEYKSAAA